MEKLELSLSFPSISDGCKPSPSLLPPHVFNMAFVNIPRDRDDPNYRYKMPRLSSKIEGRGNGIKTNISNMGEIAKALKRPPMYATKFFGCELGAQAKYEQAEEKSLVNGAHDEKDLTDILDKFITMYVLCPACGLPEMDLIVKKGHLTSKCNACGALSDLDSTHKAATYMIRNPPDQGTSTVGAKSKKRKEERRADKLTKQKAGTMGGMEGVVESEDEEAEADKKKKKKKKTKEEKEKKIKKNKSREMNDDEKDMSPSESDRTPCAVKATEKDETPIADDNEKKKKKKKKGSSDKLQHNEDLTYESLEIEDVIGRLKSFLAAKSLSSSNSPLNGAESTTPEVFAAELRLLQVAQDFNNKVRIYVALSVLFGSNLTANDLEMKLPFVKKIIETGSRPFDVLEGLEYYVCRTCLEKALHDFPYIIQKLYKHELLESDDILAYYKAEKGNPDFLKCRKAAEPVLAWLEDSESEGDESDEENSLS